jgi:copper chaperone NosL
MKRTWALTAAGALLAAAIAFAAPPPAPPADAKCPVCGMFVAKYPKWVAAVRFADSSYAWFDGPKDLLTFLLDPGRYDRARKRADVEAVYVRDYYTLEPIDGRHAFYVVGGNVLGPMGKELVPFAKIEDAEGFLRDHRAEKVLRFDEITRATLKALE